ncbi:phosphoribosylglycinamide formyltransferase [Mesobacillus zeae]|uniref:Phosphoribosylglycinamide formyltransferase n=1 Tax=Mesobacillus zeae TaxID=1917180 RepID=A0A398AWA2_9BACI|nr:phosphoribosylglycinamide formyltransferase [Mesobacillus zeae]RID81871.1 phosphoribosylglycinamide formyltransferase [Mesobacillus zeae]
MKKIAVFASGNGSNFQSLIDFSREEKLQASISLLVCDRPGAFAIERALAAGTPSFVASPKDFADKQAYESAVLQELRNEKIDFIVLAGYMRLIGPTLLREYDGRIVNIHPSLLPAFPGKDAIGQALAAGASVTGVTVHFVDEGMDTGPIIASREVAVDNNDTRESLQKKIQETEHALYPAVLEKLLNGSKERIES